jgi:hypothetical protein
VTHYFDVAVHQVRALGTGLSSAITPLGTPARRVLDVDELTILTGWAQAVAEAVGLAPECIETLLANAQEGAPWRAALGIIEPSPQLGEAIDFIIRAVRAVAPPGRVPTLDALLVSAREDRPDEPGLERLVRRVLRSALEQFCNRNGCQPDERPAGVHNTYRGWAPIAGHAATMSKERISYEQA